MQSATDNAVSAMENIDSVIRKISEITTGISSAVEEQSAATAEISRNVQQASQGTTEVSSKIGGVSKDAQSAGTAAETVLHAALEVDKVAEQLRADIMSFFDEVKAA